MKIKLLIVATLLLPLTGCIVRPKQASNKDLYQHAQANLQNIYLHQEKIGKTITLSQAIARALKYNLDYRVKVMQMALSANQLNLAAMEMLPDLGANANFSHRNNQRREYIVDSNGNITPNNNSVTPRDILTNDVGVSWNLLDFGLSYIRARQQANNALIANEQRRMAAFTLVKQVIGAYWQAYTAQTLLTKVRNFEDQVSLALHRSEIITKKRLTPLVRELDYQQILLQTKRRLLKLQGQLKQSTQELASLMNVKPGANFVLTKPPARYKLLRSMVSVNLKQLDSLALVKRPELREYYYRHKIAKLGIAAAIVNMLPGITFDYSYNYNSNKYLIHDKWLTTDFSASWNLMKLVTGPQQISVAKSATKMAKMRCAAMTVTVLTQIRLALMQYDLWYKDYVTAQKEHKVSARLYRHAGILLKTHAGSEQEMIRRGLVSLTSELDVAVSFAKAKVALANLYESVGVNLLPDNAHLLSLRDIVTQVNKMLDRQSKYGFKSIASREYRRVFAKKAKHN